MFGMLCFMGFLVALGWVFFQFIFVSVSRATGCQDCLWNDL